VKKLPSEEPKSIPTRLTGTEKKSDNGGIEPCPDPCSTNATFGAEEAGKKLPIRVFAVAAALPKVTPCPAYWVVMGSPVPMAALPLRVSKLMTVALPENAPRPMTLA